MKKKPHIIISIDTEVFEEIQLFSCKNKKLGIERNFFNMIKAIYEESTANIILNE